MHLHAGMHLGTHTQVHAHAHTHTHTHTHTPFSREPGHVEKPFAKEGEKQMLALGLEELEILEPVVTSPRAAGGAL